MYRMSELGGDGEEKKKEGRMRKGKIRHDHFDLKKSCIIFRYLVTCHFLSVSVIISEIIPKYDSMWEQSMQV